MRERDFTNREITGMFNEIKEQLERIENQTIRHNGRMTAIELKQARREGGGLILSLVIGTFLTILVSYLAWLGIQVVNIPNTVRMTLDTMEIQIK